MLEAPSKDSEMSVENFEKAVIMMTISIVVDRFRSIAEDLKVSDSNPKDAELLMHAIEHLSSTG